MSIHAKELRRLHEAAIASLASDFAQAETAAESHLSAYLCAHLPDILSALEDRERLQWLTGDATVPISSPLDRFNAAWDAWDGESDFSTAIDAARGAR